MRAPLAAPLASPPPPEGLVVRPLGERDAGPLGALMLRAYETMLDEQGLLLEDHVDVAARTMAGQFGDLRPDCSFAAVGPGPGGLAGATVVTTWEAEPLLAFALVDPAWQSRGVGSMLIARSANALLSSGATAWSLMVTRHNPAVRLYRRLGFSEQPSRDRPADDRGGRSAGRAT